MQVIFKQVIFFLFLGERMFLNTCSSSFIASFWCNKASGKIKSIKSLLYFETTFLKLCSNLTDVRKMQLLIFHDRFSTLPGLNTRTHKSKRPITHAHFCTTFVDFCRAVLAVKATSVAPSLCYCLFLRSFKESNLQCGAVLFFYVKFSLHVKPIE